MPDTRTEAAAARNALLKAGALQNAILTSANFSIIATDEKGIIQLFNVGAERMLGYRAAEVVDRLSPSDIHDPQEVMARAHALSSELGTAIAPGFEALAFKASRDIEDIYELTSIRKDGSRFPAIISITALRDDEAALIGYLLIATDNSVRKRVESELNEAMAAADRANRAKSDFLSSMSHELRTPLNAILGFAQLLESGTPAPTVTQRRNIDQILKAGWYLLELINEVLDLSLIESGKLSLSKEPVALREVLVECRAIAIADGRPQRCVLHVEDNPANLELVAQLVARRPDLRMVSATDGQLGVEYARALLPDVILMDINLPGLSGTAAMKVLRADPATALIPIIALSANAVPRDIERGLEAGFFDYVTKPIVVSQFMQALDHALLRSRATNEHADAAVVSP